MRYLILLLLLPSVVLADTIHGYKDSAKGSARNEALVDDDGQLHVVGGVSADSQGVDTLFDSDADNTAQALKTSAGVLYGIFVYNITTSDAFCQFFDLATGSVTVGTTTPKFTLLIPRGNGTFYGGFARDFASPIEFGTAITYACTTTPTVSGDPTTGLTFNGFYK